VVVVSLLCDSPNLITLTVSYPREGGGGFFSMTYHRFLYCYGIRVFAVGCHRLRRFAGVEVHFIL